MKRALLALAIALCAMAPALAGTEPKPEFRAVWITAWSPGILTPQQADETIRLAKLANLNALIVQVRKVGDAYYKSAYEPRADNIPDPSFDPLAYVIEKAHKEGIEVHAWINTFRNHMGTAPPPKGHVFEAHPDWISKKADGTTGGPEGVYLDPGVPEAADWTVNLYLDVVKNYDVDGIHFDYVRYQNQDWGYADKSIELFNKKTGRTGKPAPDDPAFSEWRRKAVTDVVRRVYKATKAIKPHVKVTASVIPWGPCPADLDFTKTAAYSRVFQDWKGWAEEGIVDAIIPMNYGHDDLFRGWLRGMVKWRAGRHAYTGMSISRLGLAPGENSAQESGARSSTPSPTAPTDTRAAERGSDYEVRLQPGSESGESAAAWLERISRRRSRSRGRSWRSPARNGAELAIEEIKAAREAGVDGICGFAFNEGSWRQPFAEALRKEVFQEPVPTPPMPWLPKPSSVK